MTSTRVVVDVMLKPEISDPQGQAVLGALTRLGHKSVQGVRQGKRFELEVTEPVDEAVIGQIADTLLANPVIEDFTIRVEAGATGQRPEPEPGPEPEPEPGPATS